MLSCLPCEILQLVLQYLRLEELVRMDYATTNQLLRPSFLSALSRVEIPRYKTPSNYIEYRKDNLLWLLRRCIAPLEILSEGSEPEISALISNSRQRLRSLRLSSCPDFPSQFFVDHLTSCRSLITLELISCPSFPPVFLGSLVRICVNVKHLNVSCNQWFDDECVTLLTTGVLDLFALNISKTNVLQDRSIQAVLDSFPNLHAISMAHCPISGDMVRLCLRQVVIPSLCNRDTEIQWLGLSCVNAFNDVSLLVASI
jgi:hypothetical protein